MCRERDAWDAAIAQVLARCAAGATPANVALMQLFMAAPDEGEARHGLMRAIVMNTAQRSAVAKLQRMQLLWDRTPDAYAAIAAIRDLTQDAPQDGTQARIRQIANMFDRAAVISPEAGVALYSLGEARLLDNATEEIVALMKQWRVFGSASRVLEIGCGTGRFLAALAPLVDSIAGIDISQNMLSAANERINGFANAVAIHGSGCDLAAAGPGPFDLALAVDSFPYLVDAGVAEDHLAECARLLPDDGQLLIFNYSYRGDPAADQADIARLAERFGFSVQRNGTTDLALWDATTFLLRRSVLR